MAASLFFSGIAFAKPVIHIAGDDDGFVVSDYSYKVAPGGGARIQLSLSDEDAARLAQLSKTKLGGRIVVAIGGTEGLMPMVRDVIPGRELELTFSDPTTFAAVQAALAK
jgi:hypothetical protein